MKVQEGFFIIHQPKHKVPGVFDLHERGMYKTRPFVTRDWAYRIIANSNLTVKLQFLCLKEKPVNDPITGMLYSYVVETVLVDLDKNLNIKTADLSPHVTDESIIDEVTAAHSEWRNSYVPVDGEKQTDPEGLKKKVLASIAERKEIIRKKLIRKNSAWVNSAVPRMIQDFKRGLYRWVQEGLYDQYRLMGGLDSEKELINKIVLFQRVYESDRKEKMRKPDGRIWQNEDEIWECWVGFAGSEQEAKRVCHTLEAVFRPLAREMAAQATATT